MIKMFMFLFKYKILKDPVNLSNHPKEFFSFSKNIQRKILDQYFASIDSNFCFDAYFGSENARYYEEEGEVNFYHCYYFDKLLIEVNVNNIYLISKFSLEEEKIDYLIDYCLSLIKEEDRELNVENLLLYPGILPDALGKNIHFMEYLVEKDFRNIKYLCVNDQCVSKQRELIQLALATARRNKFSFSYFLLSDSTLPEFLLHNFDFILYLIEEDIDYISYLSDQVFSSLTFQDKNLLSRVIISSLKKKPSSLERVEENLVLSCFLNDHLDFILYLIDDNIDHIRYIHFHHLSDQMKKKVIDYLALKLKREHISLDVMKYPFYSIFFSNFSFMEYLVDLDFRWVAVSRLSKKEENDQLISISLEKIKKSHYHFRLEDFLADGKYLNSALLENKKMIGYLISNHVAVVQYIDFPRLVHARGVVDHILFYIEKKDYEFCNDDFLIDGKYPICFSNSFRFMRYVIDKNFNHLAYMDLSMIDKREKVRIINYAFRMVYYIRGNNKSLNFDLDGYFKDSDLLVDDYFQECLKSL